ncbi:MAG TPA: lipopolysaccharide biosynthesis protein [Candidatus Pacearchaeota archaeon]|nr:lipopolysaccharide biosynthesis protein [Candidatus Pacearchaeota archaeon]
MSLTKKTLTGLSWSFFDNFSKLSINFFIGIVLARLLSPFEFGLIGMATILIAISNSFIDSGFSTALLNKKDCTKIDFETVFYFNLLSGCIFYLILFFSAGLISDFFNEPQLKSIIQVLGIGLIINSLTIVQRIKLIKKIDFKRQAKISVISSIGSGIVGIWMAFKDYGVWSLVIKTILEYSITSGLLWSWGKWKPSFNFSVRSFKEMRSFAYKLLLYDLIETTYNNIYLLIIGKYFSVVELGYYTRADRFKNLPSQDITGIVRRVSYPVLASMQDDISRLRIAYQNLIKSTMLVTFFLMFMMSATAESLTILLIGQNWLPSVIYLQLLCFVGMFYPLQTLNLNIISIKSRGDLLIKLQFFNKFFSIPFIILGIFLGIKMMIIGMIIHSFISYCLNSFSSGKLIGYPIIHQIKDISPAFFISLIAGLITYLTGIILPIPYAWKLLTQISIGALIFIIFQEEKKTKEYLFIKNIIIDKIKGKE